MNQVTKDPTDLLGNQGQGAGDIGEHGREEKANFH